MPEKTLFPSTPVLSYQSTMNMRGLSTYSQAKAAAVFLDSHPLNATTNEVLGGGTKDYDPNEPADANQNAANGITREIFYLAASLDVDQASGESYRQWDIHFQNSPKAVSAGQVLHLIETATNPGAIRLMMTQLQNSLDF